MEEILIRHYIVPTVVVEATRRLKKGQEVRMDRR